MDIKVFKEGIKDGIPIGLGYFAVAFSLGFIAVKATITPLQGFIASITTNASAGEYAAFKLMGEKGTYIEMVLITVIANARYLLMSTALSQRLPKDIKFGHRLLLGYCITDEIFGITIARKGDINPYYTYGAMSFATICWASGTALGIIMGNVLPTRMVSALSVALYGMFLAIIVPPAKESKIITLLIVMSFTLSLVCNYLPVISTLSSGTRIIILTVIISSFFAIKYPVKENADE